MLLLLLLEEANKGFPVSRAFMHTIRVRQFSPLDQGAYRVSATCFYIIHSAIEICFFFFLSFFFFFSFSFFFFLSYILKKKKNLSLLFTVTNIHNYSIEHVSVRLFVHLFPQRLTVCLRDCHFVYIGNTQISILLLCFLFLFAELVITMSE